MEDYEWLLKVSVIGDYQVGKTSLATRYSKNKFPSAYLPTIGVELTTKIVDVDGKKIKLIISDTAGQESFGHLRKNYYEGSNACVVVYSIDNRESFENVEKWFSEFKGVIKNDVPVAIIGNKIDLIEEDPSNRKVTFDELKDLANKMNVVYYAETSAKKSAEEITQCFEMIAKKYLEIMEKNY